MDVRVSYEYSLAADPTQFVAQVASQVVHDIPANIPRALLPEYIARVIVERSPSIGKVRRVKLI